MTPSFDADAVVVGAGLSGLTAARKLVTVGRTVRVFEASARLGGKIRTERFGGAHVDLGAHWIGPGQPRITALVKELGLATEPQPLDGDQVVLVGGELRRFTGFLPRLRWGATLDVAISTLRLEWMRHGVRFDGAPDDRARRALDGRTAAELADSIVRTSEARALFDLSVKLIFGVAPDELSALVFLAYLHSGRGYLSLTSFEGGAQATVLSGGMGQLVTRLADALSPRVTLEEPVTALVEEYDGVTVHTSRSRYRARRVIVAVPPPVAQRIRYEPPLPASHETLQRRSTLGAWTKCVLEYEEAFWRDEGLCGVGLATDGPVQLVIDGSEPGRGRGLLVAMVTAGHAHALAKLEPRERRAEVTKAVARLFGPRAAEPVAFSDHPWGGDRFCGGAPVALPELGVLSSLGGLPRAPTGRLHWAGTDLAERWNGYMEGALESGERAADEVLGAL
ncbi:MAG: FAD-dependent oxidoreductase [Deltaproteobacteria bacterium]|nr:FAD-dependent oxidoreductase [Deltaproteobacteria bacterium]